MKKLIIIGHIEILIRCAKICPRDVRKYLSLQYVKSTLSLFFMLLINQIKITIISNKCAAYEANKEVFLADYLTSTTKAQTRKRHKLSFFFDISQCDIRY